MKYLKKISESIEKIDINYLNTVFSEYIDSNQCSIDPGDRIYLIFIKLPFENIHYKHSDYDNNYNVFLKSISNSELLNNLLLDIKCCIERIRNEYPKLKFRFWYNDFNDIVLQFSAF